MVTGDLGQPDQFAGLGPITLGDTSGSNDAIISSGQGSSHSCPITVRAGSSGVLAITAYSGTHSWGGTVTLNNNLTLGGTGGNVTMGGLISGSGGLIIGGTNTYTISGSTKSLVNNGIVTLMGRTTFIGNTVLNSGTLKLGSGASLGNSSQISIAPGATLDLTSISAYALGSGTT